MAVLSKGTLFDPILVADLIGKVQGRSSLATLSKQSPIPFNGLKEFVFTMDSDIDIVAENGKKTHGGISLAPMVIAPIKVEYGARVSDEFRYASEEVRINILKAFNDGFAKKVARGLDLMAFHGINPRGKAESTLIGNNCFDKKVTQSVVFDAAKADENIETAVNMVQAVGGIVTGMAVSPTLSGALAKIKVNGVVQFPELVWGANPGTVKGLKFDVNPTVADGNATKDIDHAIVGDFENMFQWGYSKTIPTEVIPYGDPDASGQDLKAYNQVYIRAEMYLGWGILDATNFARVITKRA